MVTVNEQELLEFARFSGPGTRMYPSPKPGEVADLVLPAMKWIQVDPYYSRSGMYTRDRKKGLFQTVRADSLPEDLDLSVPEDLDRSLTDDQRELIREITLVIVKDVGQNIKDAINVGDLVSDTGIARNNSSVTVSYLREHHRPFLMALKTVEGRYQKRKSLLAAIQKQLARIEKLPG